MITSGSFVLQDGTKLPMDDILDMEGELFSILG